ncbi:hypothetical protein CHCC20442_4517 [Bacillus licheniformis]|nr:hypothetical protein CHCC20442_4517 [Bacillus licheniformis]
MVRITDYEKAASFIKKTKCCQAYARVMKQSAMNRFCLLPLKRYQDLS